MLMGVAVKRSILALMATFAMAAPAHAALVDLRFQGEIPEFNSVFGSGSFSLLTPFQQAYISGIPRRIGATPGAMYDFTLRYDTESTPVGGRYDLELISGYAGSNTDFSGFTPYLAFAQAGSYTYMNLVLQYVESGGATSYAFFALGDNDGDVVNGVLPETITPADLDFINVSFEAYGRSNWSVVDSQSRGLSVTFPTGETDPGTGGGQTGAIPEPATWGMMILGFGLAGASMRARRRLASSAL